MTERLYYTDAYRQRFSARVLARLEVDGQRALILDRTCFYPTSGGQPSDRGRISGNVVRSVREREDGAIIHLLDMTTEMWSDEVTGEIDWPRRFDHMQQHTGQHILTQAFLQTADIETVSFHMSAHSSTIDLANSRLTAEQVEQAELLANQVIWQNRPVKVSFATREEIEAGQTTLPLRKIPPEIDGRIRLIEIEKFDLTACGGTHVAQTGQIGQIKIVKLERRGEQLRVEFRCGQRALNDYRQKNSIINRLAAELTTGYGELEKAVVKLKEEAREAHRRLKKQKSTLLKLEVARLLETGRPINDALIVKQAFSDRPPEDLRILANQLTQQPGVIALLGLAGAPCQLLFCRSEDAPGEMNQLIKPALKILESAAGGGTPLFAQGGGPQADMERVEMALTRAERLLMGQLR